MSNPHNAPNGPEANSETFQSDPGKGSAEAASTSGDVPTTSPWGPLRVLAIVALLAFVAYFTILIFKVAWTGDFRVYIAGVRELMAHPWSPRHETLSLPATFSFAYTPYLYLVAGLGRALALTPYGAMQLAAFLNLTTLTAGLVVLFAQRWWGRGRDPFVMAATFLVVSLFARDITYFLSSEMSADSWGFVLPYPSSCAWSTFVWTLVATEQVLAAGKRWFLPTVGVGIWFTLITHPLTGSWLLGIVGLRAIVAGVLGLLADDEPGKKPMAVSAAAVVVVVLGAAALTPLWPWVSFLNKGIVTAKEGTALTEAPFATFATLYALAAVAFLRRLLAKDTVVWWLLLGWLASGAVYVVLGKADIDYRARYIFFMGFFAQVLVATQLTADLTVLANLGQRTVGRARGAFALIAVGVTGMAIGMCIPVVEARLASPSSWLAKPDAASRYTRDLDPLIPYLNERSVVLFSDPKAAMRLTVATGARTTFVTFATHLPDAAERRSHARRFFKRRSVSTRATMVQRWGATHALIVHPTPVQLAELTTQLGPPVFSNRDMSLFSTEALPKPKPKRPRRRRRRAPQPVQPAIGVSQETSPSFSPVDGGSAVH